jgi:hypothetical protein
MRLVGLVKMCLNKTYNEVHVGKNVSDAFPVQNDVKQGDALLPLFFNFTFEYVIMKVQENEERLKLNGKHNPLVCADNVNILD